ncbi:MAG: site-2 protease family protein, partial [Deltaproteobacteria bacterium]|nr:site-2 protease family protein [Deltaproteobacteria bacterium]
MDLILSLGHKIFYFIVLISVLVIVHEWGHFIVARWCGVRVEAFSLFFGKVLWKRMWRGTEWRLSAIPFGGYVKMLGQSDLGSDQNEAMYREKALEELTGKPHEEITEHDAAALDASAIAERAAQLKSVSFAHKSVWQRSAIVFAGPLMNVVLTVMIFTAMFFVGY